MLRFFYRLCDRVRHRRRLRTLNTTRASGLRGEDLAHRCLQAAGMTVIARNYRTPNGSAEVDIIAAEGECIVFVEVKTRASVQFGTPESAVDANKRRQIFRGAQDFLHRSDRTDGTFRFDIVTVLTGEREVVEHIRDAFWLPSGEVSAGSDHHPLRGSDRW